MLILLKHLQNLTKVIKRACMLMYYTETVSLCLAFAALKFKQHLHN